MTKKKQRKIDQQRKTHTAGRRVSWEDQRVSARLRVLRQSRKITQEQLAASVGLTFQQIQKYESGQNRISAGRLGIFAEVIGIPVGWFYGEDASVEKKLSSWLDRSNPAIQAGRAFDGIPPGPVRSNLLRLIASLHRDHGPETAENRPGEGINTTAG